MKSQNNKVKHKSGLISARFDESICYTNACLNGNLNRKLKKTANELEMPRPDSFNEKCSKISISLCQVLISNSIETHFPQSRKQRWWKMVAFLKSTIRTSINICGTILLLLLADFIETVKFVCQTISRLVYSFHFYIIVYDSSPLRYGLNSIRTLALATSLGRQLWGNKKPVLCL